VSGICRAALLIAYASRAMTLATQILLQNFPLSLYQRPQKAASVRFSNFRTIKGIAKIRELNQRSIFYDRWYYGVAQIVKSRLKAFLHFETSDIPPNMLVAHAGRKGCGHDDRNLSIHVSFR
jgi:hypothetical protein